MVVRENSGIFRGAREGLSTQGKFGSQGWASRFASRHVFVLASQQFAVMRTCRAQSSLEFRDAGLDDVILGLEAFGAYSLRLRRRGYQLR
jgi:hypothetical protein